MEQETLIQLKMSTLLDTLFEGCERSVSIHRMPNDSFKVYITSPDSFFLARLIGKNGETINALKHIFSVWAFYAKIRLQVWVEREPIKNND